MAKKIAGVYIVRLDVEMDKAKLDKQAQAQQQVFNRALVKNNQMEVKGAQKQAEKVTKEANKGVAKQVDKDKKKGGVLSKVGAGASGIAGLFGVGLGASAIVGLLAGRFLSKSAEQPLSGIAEGTAPALANKELSQLTGANTGTISKLQTLAGKDIGTNLITGIAKKFGRFDINALQQALSQFNAQKGIRGKEAVAEAYGLTVNDLLRLQTKTGDKGLLKSFREARGLTAGQTSKLAEAEIQIENAKIDLDLDKQIAIFSRISDRAQKSLLDSLILNNRTQLEDFKQTLENLETALISDALKDSTGILLDKTLNRLITIITNPKTLTDSVVKTVINPTEYKFAGDNTIAGSIFKNKNTTQTKNTGVKAR